MVDSAVNASQRPLLWEHITDHRHPKVYIDLRGVGDEEQIGKNIREYVDDAVDETMAAKGHQGLILSHTTALATSQDGTGYSVTSVHHHCPFPQT
jgi:hypothetical protein